MNQSSNNSYTKYRPYLTLSELDTCISSLRGTGANPALIQYLSTFRDKISVGRIAPQVTLKPSLQDKLGFSQKELTTNLVSQREQAYNKWLLSPLSCSIQELARSRMYRYENDLMSPEEESEYESQIEKGY
jgi:hypothetical protein